MRARSRFAASRSRSSMIGVGDGPVAHRKSLLERAGAQRRHVAVSIAREVAKRRRIERVQRGVHRAPRNLRSRAVQLGRRERRQRVELGSRSIPVRCWSVGSLSLLQHERAAAGSSRPQAARRRRRALSRNSSPRPAAYLASAASAPRLPQRDEGVALGLLAVADCSSCARIVAGIPVVRISSALIADRRRCLRAARARSGSSRCARSTLRERAIGDRRPTTSGHAAHCAPRPLRLRQPRAHDVAVGRGGVRQGLRPTHVAGGGAAARGRAARTGRAAAGCPRPARTSARTRRRRRAAR